MKFYDRAVRLSAERSDRSGKNLRGRRLSLRRSDFQAGLPGGTHEKTIAWHVDRDPSYSRFLAFNRGVCSRNERFAEVLLVAFAYARRRNGQNDECRRYDRSRQNVDLSRGRGKNLRRFPHLRVYRTDEYLRRVTAEIPADHGNARYRYYKVFDAAEEGTDPLNYKRVKVNTAYSFEFYEVVFTDKNGRAFAIENAVVDETAYGDHATRFAAALTDEQRTFRSSGTGAYVLSEGECDALAAADSLLTGSGYAVGSAPLSSLLNAAGVAIFGRNTFGIRFSAFLFGFLSLLAAANLAKKLFLKDSFAVCTVVLAVAGGGLFAAAISSSSAVYAAFFLLMALSLAVSFFGNAYSFGNFRASSINVCLTGLFFGFSAACAPQTVFCFPAFALIYAVSLRRRYLEYKAEEKAASGLAKEDAYQRYRRSALGAGGSIAFGFVLIPFLVWLISFAIVSSNATAFGGKGFRETSSAMFGGAFIRAYRENPFLFLVGFGKENAGAGVLFFNKVVSIASLCGVL